MNAGLAPFKALIKQRCGLSFEGHSEEKLAAVLKQRIGLTACADAAAYYECLSASAAEFQHLINQLTINETYFFREAEQLLLLTQRLAPRLLNRRSDNRPLRILSAGCSTGEEPYSIVMALFDQYGAGMPGNFSVIGADIDTLALKKARDGRYSEFSFRGVPAAIKSRYFDRHLGLYRVKESVRKQVEFHELNLLAAEFPPALRDFDVVFLRNVSIYFDEPVRRAILQNLAVLMKAEAYLVVGSAETLACDLGIFSLVKEDEHFYFSKGQAPRSLALKPAIAKKTPSNGSSAINAGYVGCASPTQHILRTLAPPNEGLVRQVPHAGEAPRTVLAQTESSGPSAPPAAATVERAQQLVREKRYDDALALLAPVSGDARAILLQAYIQLERKAFESAEAAAQRVLQSDAWSIDAFLLLGLSAKWRGRNDDAVRWFKQAVYARHQCWPAHYYLAEIYRADGEAGKARREYRVVLQHLATAAENGATLLPLALPAADVRFLCEHQLAKLEAARA